MSTKNEARSYLQSIAAQHLASNARQYSFKTYTNDPTVNAFGMKSDLSPIDGKVVEVSDDWVVVKTARTEFFISDRALLTTVPSVGDAVHIETYARRGFDGIRLDAPKEDVSESGFVFRTYKIGETRSKLPIDRDQIQSSYLIEMMDQVESLESPDGIRTLAQILIDAGASSAPVSYKDAPDSQVFDVPPTLQFRVNNSKFDGWLNIVYDRSLDYYLIQLVAPGSREVVTEVRDIDVFSMPQIILNLIDDGSWKFAKVEITKSASKKQKKAA